MKSNLLYFIIWTSVDIFYSISINGNDFKEIGKYETTYVVKSDYFNNAYYFGNESEINYIDLNKGNVFKTLLISNNVRLLWPIFKIIHKSLQPNSSNGCSSADCSQLCLPTNKTNYECVCSEHKYLCDNRVSFLKIKFQFYIQDNN